MNQNHLSTDIQKGRILQTPGSWLKGAAIRFAKSLVTWEGRDVSQIDEANFLREGFWEENLKLLSTISGTTSIKALMTKDLYQWQPKETYIAEGFSSAEKQKEAMALQAYFRWLQMGTVAGIAYFFFKSTQFNFNCLSTMDERNCRILYGAALSQPGTLAKIAFAAGLWTIGGWLVNQFSHFGFLGYIKEEKLDKDLVSIYRSTADSVRTAFWNAVDNKDEAAARKIYDQVQSIKNSSEYLKNSISSLLGVSETNKEKVLKPFNSFNLLIEDLLSQDIKTLFPSEIKEETTLEPSIDSKDNTVLEVPNNVEATK